VEVYDVERVSSGIKGLDELLSGGFPKGKCVLVVGGPGSGKTIFAMQFLKSGAEMDEAGLYITLDETPDQIKEEMSSLGWDLEGLERSGKLFLLDATQLRRVKGSPPGSYVKTSSQAFATRLPELTLQSLIETTVKLVEEEDVQRVAIDPITALTIRYGETLRRRRAVLRLFDALSNTGCTSIITSELRSSLLERRFQVEEFLSQGVIILHTILHGGDVVKAIQIEKMRGIKHDTQLRPYIITESGIEVYPKDKVF
jgi:circadian clock protein KaiC